MVSLAPHLKSLVKSISAQPVDALTLDSHVQKVLNETSHKVSVENRKSQWEYLLKNEIFALATTEGKALKDPETKYYDILRDRLDLVLTFTEHDACEATFPFTVLQDLLETQTITSCSHIFSWIESRAIRLTKGMVPQKGKALILLRTLNDLLRRLSKMGSTTIFCGRILTFLSGVFPLGERSGVNLRGEYGPTWEGVKEQEKNEEDSAIPDVSDTQEPKVDSEKMQVDDAQAEGDAKKTVPAVKTTDKKEDFYNTFWSLQLPFSKPPLFAVPNTFADFQDAVNKVLPVIREATTKERAMMGSRSTGSAGSLKRKRELEATEGTVGSEYFFAKFLTSPDLLELEIADTHFRRQFIFQLLILLNHLLTFTKSSKATWATSRNRSLQMEFTLESADAQWVQETISKATDELRQTAPNGPVFKDTVNAILEREKNWVKWKNELCTPFDREPWGETVEETDEKIGMEESTREARKKMREQPEDWRWDLGTEPLTEIWGMGFRDLQDLENPFQPGDVKDFVKKIKLEDARIDQRKKALVRASERIAQVRAKANATSAPSPVKEPTNPKETVLSAPEAARPDTPSTLLPSTPLSGARSPLHPSLPAKPGATAIPSKSGSSQDAPPKTALATTSAPTPTLTSAPATAVAAASSPAPAAHPVDEQIARLEENKQRWSWLALRTARDQYLQYFGKIGTGDLILLQHEIEQGVEKEKQEREKTHKDEEPSSGGIGLGIITSATGAGEEHGASPLIIGGSLGGSENDVEKMAGVEDGSDTKVTTAAEAQEDIKMES